MNWVLVFMTLSMFYSYVLSYGDQASVVKFKFNLDPYGEAPLQDGRRRHRDNKKSLRVRNDFLFSLNKDALRIRGGNATDTTNYPYIAAIIINGRLWCAGTIVDVNWVLTAAHCLNYVLHVAPMKTLGQYVKVRVGSAQAHEGGLLVDVAGAVRHPKFEEEPVPHADVALLKLTENLEFSTHINLIKINEDMREPYAQSFVSVTGWGATRGTDTAFREHTPDLMTARLKVRTVNYCRDAYQLVSGFQFTADFFCASLRNGTRDACLGTDTAFREHTPDLMTARLKVRTVNYCRDAYQLVSGFQFTADFFCASLRNGTRDACLFDAGAPATQHNKLMGVMSFGPERCGHEYQPAVFIKAFYFRDFVKHTISSYKTTAELIEAMKDIDKVIRPPVHVKQEHVVVEKDEQEVTEPDYKHD
ncbi:Serine protease similarity trypsin family [Danaus plexippus plexippus]|uniref:trypsin n=1 Tax=Danaus plexippus plexippus TaxID=278856 RepID=A0A212EWZ7_DANPL|nr:Serine protease similarity trypsin family [Danaus plexippus plexippus]